MSRFGLGRLVACVLAGGIAWTMWFGIEACHFVLGPITPVPANSVITNVKDVSLSTRMKIKHVYYTVNPGGPVGFLDMSTLVGWPSTDVYGYVIDNLPANPNVTVAAYSGDAKPKLLALGTGPGTQTDPVMVSEVLDSAGTPIVVPTPNWTPSP